MGNLQTNRIFVRIVCVYKMVWMRIFIGINAIWRTGILSVTGLMFMSMHMAQAQIEVDITEGTYRPLPIAIPDFTFKEGVSEATATRISQVVRSNLSNSGLFDILDAQSFIQRDLDINVWPRFSDWKIIKADALVVGEVSRLDDGQLRVVFKLWDIFGETYMRMEGRVLAGYRNPQENWRRIAHKISDDIYARLTGEERYFDSRMVFISESGPRTNRKKRLTILDQDGANPEFLTSGNEIVLTPRFSPTEQLITYLSYENDTPRVYLMNVANGRREVLGDFEGMTFAPRFSPDGQSVIMTQSTNGNSDIYIMDLRRRIARRLTTHPAIDTSPSFSPDGKYVVFNSDRGGSPQLYIMKRDGTPMDCPSGISQKACRVSFGDGRYSTPVWSPRGDLIAFTKQHRGRFHIGVIRPDGEGEKLLTEAYLDEGPEWAPNGRVIVFFREDRPGSGPRLWSVDLTGRNLRRVPTPADASDPAWSPLLK